ncbi:MAG: phosphoribosylformylglycinamidine synthase subunit PurL [Polyangiales bacterium]
MSASAPLPNDPSVNLKLAKEFGLKEAEYDSLLQSLGRLPTYAELGVVSVMWSEHCSYKSSRVHLSRLPTTGQQVVQGPGENAGAVDIGDGYCAVFKMESHNHPSYIEPYQGAATGVGGILRDVFTMGARPIASLNSLRFGEPDHPKTPMLVRGVVAGIGGYGNCIGVPTVGGEVQFDKSYNGNILVNAFTVGVAKTEDLFFGVARGVGNSILYVGAKTGRDGIHGATMASAEFGDDTDAKLPTVQVGDPFMEKLLLEACLEIFASDCLEGVQDMGAAGLTSSSVEMADRAGTGIELNLDAIPRRTEALTPYEMLLSESQERMLMVAKKGREQEVLDICKKWDLDASIVGVVTDTQRFVCRATADYDPLRDPESKRAPIKVVDLPVSILTASAPKYDRPQAPAAIGKPIQKAVQAPSDLGAELLRMIGAPNIGSRQWIYRQYDHIVQDGTVVRPGEGDAAVIRAFCSQADPPVEKFLALSVDCNGRHVQLDPRQGTAMAVAECARNIACVGGKALGATDCLNFANPEVPETMWRFAQSIDGMAEACLALDTPIVSGNVSLYNETDGKPILPTPGIAMVGQLERPEDHLTFAFKDEGDVIAHLGVPSRGALGGSEWLTQASGEVCGEPVGIDLKAERALQDCVIVLARAGALKSAHDISDGGFAVCVAESCIGGEIGATVKLPSSNNEAEPYALLFSEEPSRIVVSFSPGNKDTVANSCKKHGVPFEEIGRVNGRKLHIDSVVSAEVSTLANRHRAALDSIVG